MAAATPQTIDDIVLKHAAEVGRPFGKCKRVSYALADELVASGYPAVVLRGDGYEGNARQADKRWLDLNGQFYWRHYVVQVEDKVYDLTRRQFHPSASKICIQTLKEFGDEWQDVAEDCDWREKHELDEAPVSPTM